MFWTAAKKNKKIVPVSNSKYTYMDLTVNTG